MTYNVFGGTLNLNQSISQSQSQCCRISLFFQGVYIFVACFHCRLQVLEIWPKCLPNRRSPVGKLNQIHQRSKLLLIYLYHPAMSLFQHRRRHEGRRSQKTVYPNQGIFYTRLLCVIQSILCVVLVHCCTLFTVCISEWVNNWSTFVRWSESNSH